MFTEWKFTTQILGTAVTRKCSLSGSSQHKFLVQLLLGNVHWVEVPDNSLIHACIPSWLEHLIKLMLTCSGIVADSAVVSLCKVHRKLAYPLFTFQGSRSVVGVNMQTVWHQKCYKSRLCPPSPLRFATACSTSRKCPCMTGSRWQANKINECQPTKKAHVHL